MVPERIEREIRIDAPVERVWTVVTEPEHLNRWLGDTAEIDLRPGGAGLLVWEKYGASRLRVERVEPPHLFAFRWARGEDQPVPGKATLVEMSLTAEGEGTLLRVVESGFPELDLPEEEKERYVAENTGGWRSELDELREYLARPHAG
ncbi:SRPBCC domain-containing protein [Rhizohabitans arisaemae]|uniref:SRPBCC domain-containing protein n=1 Tax=Rhizohabitans arisaemae TaxID=2720610 RepID=UPI0024B10CC6|nr:SRPBCC domain-containing protein [Rhizohabitans arisaemae]